MSANTKKSTYYEIAREQAMKDLKAGKGLRSIPVVFRNDQKFCEEAIVVNGKNFPWVLHLDKVTITPEMCMQALRTNPEVYCHMLKSGVGRLPEIQEFALEQCPLNLKNVKKEKITMEMCVKCVKSDPLSIMYAPTSLLEENYELCQYALENCKKEDEYAILTAIPGKFKKITFLKPEEIPPTSSTEEDGLETVEIYDYEGRVAERFTINKDGEKEGEYRSYWGDGQLWEECTYKNGERDGEHREWDNDGELTNESTYKNGKLEKHQLWVNGKPRMKSTIDENGIEAVEDYGLGDTIARYTLKEGKKEGKYEEHYTKNGKLRKECFYKDGKIDGDAKIWWEDGSLQVEITYKNGKKEGEYRDWYENRILRRESTYKDGKLEGICRDWYYNGILWMEYTYKNGKKDGIYREWCEDGKLKEERVYENGVEREERKCFKTESSTSSSQD